jgi:hypothetical protein
MVVDRGHDFPQYAQEKLDSYGESMWRFRDGAQGTTKALNLYRGDLRGYVVPPTLTRTALTLWMEIRVPDTPGSHHT